MSKNDSAGCAMSVIVMCLMGSLCLGWILNIVTICKTGFESFDGMLVARCIGVFVAPLGAVLGWI